MNDLKDTILVILAGLGLDIMAMKSGLVGGFVSLAYEKKRAFRQALVSIASGAVLAGYLGPMAATFFELEGAVGGVGFLVGLLAMRIIPALFGYAEEKTSQVLEKVTKKTAK